MSDHTNLLGLPYLQAAQAQKHVTANEAFRLLDGIAQLSVKDRDLATPPASPAEGDRYIVAASPTGAWSGWANSVALRADGAWFRLPPQVGWTAWVADEGWLVVWTGSAWVRLTSYAEGKLVPTFAFGSPGSSSFNYGSPAVQYGFWQRIANRVFYHGKVAAVVTKGSGSTNFNVLFGWEDNSGNPVTVTPVFDAGSNTISANILPFSYPAPTNAVWACGEILSTHKDRIRLGSFQVSGGVLARSYFSAPNITDGSTIALNFNGHFSVA